jgi:hypothetical protein
MSCCGQNRQALKQNRISVTAEPPPPPSSRVKYTGHSEMLMRGPSSGRSYLFAPQGPAQEIEASDLAAIMATGLFGPE